MTHDPYHMTVTIRNVFADSAALSAHWVENIDQLPAAKVWYIVSKAKIMFKKPVYKYIPK